MKNKNNFKKEEIVDVTEVTEEVVEAVANAIVEEAEEQGKEVVEIIEEIIDEEVTEENINEEVTEENINEEVTDENANENADLNANENANENADENADKINEVIETVKPGFVVKCEKLNVRSEANTNSNPIHVIDKGTEVVVDLNASTEDFYKVITAAGIEGFCMSKYITIK